MVTLLTMERPAGPFDKNGQLVYLEEYQMHAASSPTLNEVAILSHEAVIAIAQHLVQAAD